MSDLAGSQIENLRFTRHYSLSFHSDDPLPTTFASLEAAVAYMEAIDVENGLYSEVNVEMHVRGGVYALDARIVVVRVLDGSAARRGATRPACMLGSAKPLAEACSPLIPRIPLQSRESCSRSDGNRGGLSARGGSTGGCTVRHHPRYRPPYVTGRSASVEKRRCRLACRIGHRPRRPGMVRGP